MDRWIEAWNDEVRWGREGRRREGREGREGKKEERREGGYIEGG